MICAKNPMMITWFMLDFRDNIREYRYDSERLVECSHLDHLSPFNFEFDAGQITQVGFYYFCFIGFLTNFFNSCSLCDAFLWSSNFVIYLYVAAFTDKCIVSDNKCS